MTRIEWLESLLTETQAAEYLSTTQPNIYSYRKSGKLRPSRKSRPVLYDPAVLDQFVEVRPIRRIKQPRRLT